MKKIKIIIILSGLITLFILLYLILLCSPHLLFNNKFSYRNFDIYSTSPIEMDLRPEIDETIKRLRSSEIYDSTVKQSVYMIHNTFYYTLTEVYARDKAGYHQFLLNNSMIVPPFDPNTGDIVFNNGTRRKLFYTLTHESVHSLEENYLGFKSVFTTPQWIIEGYAYYITNMDQFTCSGKLKPEIPDKVRKSKEKLNPDRNDEYWMYGAMVAYFLNFEHLTFDQLVEIGITEDQAKERLEQWSIERSDPRPHINF